MASNGIIHMVDGLLLPPSILPILPHRCDIIQSRIVLVRPAFVFELVRSIRLIGPCRRPPLRTLSLMSFKFNSFIYYDAVTCPLNVSLIIFICKTVKSNELTLCVCVCVCLGSLCSLQLSQWDRVSR